MAETGQQEPQYERYEGGGPEAERLMFEQLAAESDFDPRKQR